MLSCPRCWTHHHQGLVLLESESVFTSLTVAKFPIIFTLPRTQTLGGNAFFSSSALTAYDDGHIEFVTDVDGKFYGECYLDPDVIDGGTITAVKFKGSLYANATAGDTVMEVSTKAIADGETFNPASLDGSTEGPTAITVPATAYLRTDFTFTFTPANFGEGDIILVEIFHEGTSTTPLDSLAANTLLKTLAFIEVTF